MSLRSRDSTVECQNGRQELEPQYLVNKKTNSGTWPKGSPAYVVYYSCVLFITFMSDDFEPYLKVSKYCMLCFWNLVTRLSSAKMVDKS